jgi:hypothetical protein
MLPLTARRNRRFRLRTRTASVIALASKMRTREEGFKISDRLLSRRRARWRHVSLRNLAPAETLDSFSP